MATILTATPAPADVKDPPQKASRPPRPGRRFGDLALILVALAYAVSQLQLQRLKLGWDETIYLSQVSKTVPAAFFSAPRARGITWLAEPLAAVSSSVPALRLYLTVLSGAALYLAFRVWFRVLPTPAVVIAAGLFGGLWITRFYGAELMPNLWVGFALVAAVGGFLRLTRARFDALGLLALPLGLAGAALMRPSDAAWAVFPLLVVTAVVPAWRRNWPIYLLTLTGSLLGALPWVIEAEHRFGGVAARLRTAGAIQGGLGWHPQVLLQHWQTLDGPLLCRPCSPPSSPPVDTAWFLLLLPLAVLAVFAARRLTRAYGGSRGSATVVVPALVGFSLAVPYLLLVNYSAPRFLLPAFALLSLPAGLSLWWLLSATPGRARRYAVAGVVALALSAQLLSQQQILTGQVSTTARSTRAYTAIATGLHRVGVQAPCVLSGYRSPQLAFYAGCGSRNVTGHDASISSGQLVALGRHTMVAVIVRPGLRPPHFAKHWQRHELPAGPGQNSWAAYLEPRTAT